MLQWPAHSIVLIDTVCLHVLDMLVVESNSASACTALHRGATLLVTHNHVPESVITAFCITLDKMHKAVLLTPFCSVSHVLVQSLSQLAQGVNLPDSNGVQGCTQ